MSGSALFIMLIAMVLIWGGLVFSIIHLTKNPDIDMSQIPDEH